MKMMKKTASLWAALVGSALLMTGCTIQTTPSLLTSTSNVQDVNEKILNEVPFAYDLVVDTISYNSCVGNGLNTGGVLHGIKLGANEGFVDTNGSGSVKAGLKLRSDFLNYIAQNVQPVFPNTTVVPSQIQFILENSEKNKELFIQYAVRSKTDLSVVPDVIIPNTNNALQLTRDGVYEQALLSANPVINNITKNIQFGNNKNILAEGPHIYNLGTLSVPDNIEASLGYSSAADDSFPAQAGVDDGLGAGEEYSDRVRERFSSGQQLLTITYGNPTISGENETGTSFGLNNPRRPEANQLSKAYGRGFELSFVTKNPSVPSQRRNILNRVIEKNLETGTQASGVSWSCENFVIMKTNQWNNKKISEPSCAEIKSEDLAYTVNNAGAVLRAKLARIRRHYSESQWGVGFLVPANTANPSLATRASLPICLVNKAVDCYLPTKGLILSNPDADVGVNYNAALDGNVGPNNECYLSRFSQMGVTYTGNKTGDAARALGRCPQFASVCVRASASF